jgi:hypothetical protein
VPHEPNGASWWGAKVADEGPDERAGACLALTQGDVSLLAEHVLAPWLDSGLIAALAPPGEPGGWWALPVSAGAWPAVATLLNRVLGRIPALVVGLTVDGLPVFTPALAGERVVDSALFVDAPLRVLSLSTLGPPQPDGAAGED